MLSNIWNSHVKPYLSGQDTFHKRNRLENWRRVNAKAVQICPIDLGLSESNSDCSHIKANAYLYLKGFKNFPVDWEDRSFYYQFTAAILDLGRFCDFDDYQRAVSKSSRGNDNRSAKKARGLGYRVRIIDEDAYQASISRIRRSKLVRTGGLMLDAIWPRAATSDNRERAIAEQPDCQIHWSICWGVFKGEELIGYALLTRCGNLIRTIHIMGHREALRDGAVKLLMFDIIRSLFESELSIFRGISLLYVRRTRTRW